MEGRRLIAVAGVVSGVVVGLALWTHGAGADGWLAATRQTARMSLALFLPVAAASSVNALWGGKLGKWLLRNRRHVGLSLALSHAVHAVAFMMYASAKGVSITTVASAGTLYGGGFGYVMLAAMAATSTSAAIKALGRKRWKALHKTGVYVLAAIFMLTYGPRALAGRGFAIVATTALLGVLGLRFAARLRAQRRRNA